MGDISARRLAALGEVCVPIEPRAAAASTLPQDMWSQVANFCDQSSVAALRLLDKTTREGATVAAQGLVVSRVQELDAALLAFGSGGVSAVTLRNVPIGIAECQRLAANRFVSKLRLRGNVICTEGARALAANKSLTALELPKNFVGDEGARLLATSTSITELDLENNYIADEGAQALAVNTLITKLNLSDNDISDEAARFLADNTNSNSLDLTENMLGESGRQALEHARSRFESLQF